MKKLYTVISEEALKVLADYQKKNGIGTRDDALDQLLKEYSLRSNYHVE